MTELPPPADHLQAPELAELLTQMDGRLADLILVEGFKQTEIPKIEVHRPSLGKPLLAEHDSRIIAVASDAELAIGLPVLNLNAPKEIAAFILDWLNVFPNKTRDKNE